MHAHPVHHLHYHMHTHHEQLGVLTSAGPQWHAGPPRAAVDKQPLVPAQPAHVQSGHPMPPEAVGVDTATP